MSLILDGTNGLSDVDGSAATPAIRGSDANTGIFFPAADTIAFAEGGAESARFDSSGNLLVGTTTQAGSARFTMQQSTNDTAGGLGIVSADGNGALISRLNDGGLTFRNGGAERARITSNGEFCVGKTTNNDTSIGCVVIPTDGNTGRFKATGDNSSSGAAVQVLNTSGSSTFLVRPNGNAQNVNNSYGAISDIKLKENIVDATPKLDKLNQVRVVNYNLIGSQHKQIGVVAQELEQIFPGMVEESPDEDKDGNRLDSTTKAVKYSVFVPMLIKAIQEQQAIITALTARVDALEGAQA